jgi:hypothetical protein
LRLLFKATAETNGRVKSKARSCFDEDEEDEEDEEEEEEEDPQHPIPLTLTLKPLRYMPLNSHMPQKT